jgi:hypothetical protein
LPNSTSVLQGGNLRAALPLGLSVRRPPHSVYGGAIAAPGRLVAREDMTVALTVLAGRLCDPQVAEKAVGLSHSVKFGPAQLRFPSTAAS